MRRLIVLLAAMLLALLWLGTAMADEETVMILDHPVTVSSEEIDLSDLKSLNSRQTNQLIKDLAQLPRLKRVDLSHAKMALDDSKKLVNAWPEVSFHLSVTVAYQQYDNQIEVFDVDSVAGNKPGAQSLLNALMLFPNVKDVYMFKTSVSVRNMEPLFAAYPDINFHWTVRIDTYYIRNDVTAFSTLKGRQDPRYTAKQMEPLIYCKDLLAIDLGHNNVSDLTFLTHFPKLRRLIIIDSRKPITDLTPLTDLNDLEYIELFMQNITDLTPLAGKEHLMDLNLCHNNVTDLSPLYTCPNLKRLHISYNPGLTAEEVAKLQAVLPECVIETETYQSTGAGWREHPHYQVIFDTFHDRVYYPFEESAPLE